MKFDGSGVSPIKISCITSPAAARPSAGIMLERARETKILWSAHRTVGEGVGEEVEVVIEQSESARHPKGLQEISRASEKPGAENEHRGNPKALENTKNKRRAPESQEPRQAEPETLRGRAKAVRRSGQARARGNVGGKDKKQTNKKTRRRKPLT